jgi:prepilin-type N-terminal cleavage/methylation domain-containing protein
MKNKNGFTLIELLVVIAILGILSSIAVLNTGKNPDRDVKLERDRFITFLREVQNRTITTEKVSSPTGKICGYGVNFINASSARLFYVVTATGGGKDKLDVDCSANAVKKYTSNVYSSSVLVSSSENFNLAYGVTFQGAVPKDIFFQIPHGTAFYDGNVLPSAGQTLTLTKTVGSVTSTANVVMQSSGLIQ